MDRKLVAWGRAVKSARRDGGMPSLWLFTDRARLADPCAAAARLPRGLCGVVFRHDDDPGRVALGRRLAGICRERRLALVVAGDWRLAAALGAGVHLRGGRGRVKGGGLVTSSAHSARELVQARRAGAGLVFLSPAFVTASHPGGVGMGAARWLALARRYGGAAEVGALGGVGGENVRRLAGCRVVAAIAALC